MTTCGRLVAVVDRQRRELDRLHALAAGESVVAMARGALMERLGLSSAEAAGQLAELSAATGIPPAEMAASVLSGRLSDSVAVDAGAPGDETAAAGHGPVPGGAAHVRPRAAGSRSLLVEAAAELAADGAELAAMLAAQVLALGRAAVVLWLLEADGALALLGEAGLSGADVSRWQRIPPQLDCPAQRVATEPPTCGGARAVRQPTAAGHRDARRGPGGPGAAASGTANCSA